MKKIFYLFLHKPGQRFLLIGILKILINVKYIKMEIKFSIHTFEHNLTRYGENNIFNHNFFI